MALIDQFPYANFHELNLDWLLATMKRVQSDIDDVNAWKDAIQEGFEAVEARLVILEKDQASLRTAFSEFTAAIDQKFEDRSNQLNIQFQTLRYELEQRVNDLINQVFEQINLLRAEITAQLDYNQLWVEARLSQFLASLPDYTQILVDNPVRGYRTTVQIAIDDLYDVFSRLEGLTAQEYDNAGLTAAAYDGLGLTAAQYDLYGSRYIITNGLYFMYDPFDGIIKPVKDVVNELATLHRTDSLTATAYDVKDLSAAYYDGLDLTAYEYDWEGATKVA